MFAFEVITFGKRHRSLQVGLYVGNGDKEHLLKIGFENKALALALCLWMLTNPLLRQAHPSENKQAPYQCSYSSSSRRVSQSAF